MSGDVPVIDIGGLSSDRIEARRAVARELGAACEKIGFIVVTGHGVDPALIHGAYDAAQAFFDLPDTEKRRAMSGAGGGFRGYTPLASEALAQTLEVRSRPDLFEAFTVGRTSVPDDAYHRRYASDCFAPNAWPAAPDRFGPLAAAYYEAMEGLALRLMRGFALALDLEEDFFEDKFDKHISNMRFINYPEQRVAPEPGRLRCGAHSDYGSLTIVYARAADGGLQVKAAAGGWSDVPLVPGGFVINLGDLLAEWTNDRWVSTVHRVANPMRPGAEKSNRRQSIAFFHQPNHDALIECIPTCRSVDNPPRHAPILSGEHLMKKVSRQAV